MTDLANAQQSTIATSKPFTADGKPVRHIRSKSGMPMRSSAQRLDQRLHGIVVEPAWLGAMLALAQGWCLLLVLLATRVVIFGSIPCTAAMIVRHVEDRMEPGKG